MESRKVSMLGVPMDLGGGLRGVDMGPSAIRFAGLEERIRRMGIEYEDLGNLGVQRPESREPGDPHARFLNEISRCCARLRRRVEPVVAAGGLPIVIGGDHSIAAGTVAAISSHYHAKGEKIGLIWFDAHGDFNTPETSHSGNIHGMPLAACCGYGPEALTHLGTRVPMVDPSNVVLIGVHSLDSGERKLIAEAGVRVFSVREVDIHGMDACMREAVKIATNGTAGFHLSFDIDGCDPSVAPGVGTPVRGGMTEREAHLVMETAAECGKMLGLEVTEINPLQDTRNTTAEVAVDLILSALGKLVF